MPIPIAILSQNVTQFVDTDQTIGDTNYYRVSAWIDGHEMFSEEITTYVDKVDYYNVVFRDSNQYVRKVDSKGSVLWSHDSGTGNHFVRMANTLDNDVIVSDYNNGTVKCLSSFDGNVRWTKSIGGWSRLIVVNDGYVYLVGNDDHYLYKVNIESGTSAYTFNNHTDVIYDISFDFPGNTYSASKDGTLRKISPDGNELWSFIHGNTYVRRVAVDSSGNSYTTTGDRYLRKIDTNGNEVWKIYYGVIMGDLDIDSQDFVYLYTRPSNNADIEKIDPDV